MKIKKNSSKKFNYFGGVRYSYDSLPEPDSIMVKEWGHAFQF
jgi:hypothetical protein